MALATTFVVAVGATTTRYTAIIKEMNVLFSGQVMVVSEGAIVIQAIPIGGGLLPQNYTENMIRNLTNVEKVVSILFITPLGVGEIIQPVPVNFSIGIPVQDWHSMLGPTPLREGGRFPTNESGTEVVVGASLADQHNWLPGTEVMINGYMLEVSGVLDTKLAILNRCFVMPLKLTQKIYNYPKSVNIISAKPIQGCPQEKLAESIEQRVEFVDALTEDRRNDMIQPVLAQIETWNLGIQTLIFIMSLILVMTVTVMSVSERRRDFATLDAIGAPLSYVFRVVVFEAGMIGFLGGALGIIFGTFGALSLASLYTDISLSQFFPSIFEIASPIYMLEIFLSVVAICCLGGVIPALRAMKMRIAEVLRAEY